jgi:transcriptional regulator with XRE-family HTH domain
MGAPMREGPLFVPQSPEDIRLWRRECCRVTQSRLASELGIGRRTLGAYERGEIPVPALLLWALAGIFKPLRSQLRMEARRARANEARRIRRQLARQRRLAGRARERQRARARRAFLQLLGRRLRGRGVAMPDEVAEMRCLGTLIRDPIERTESLSARSNHGASCQPEG